ncbi:hypothetical protein ACO2Q8_10280 [Larkinella sp. VNQ87]|uniref:hypothetical protein n=1 Tax=Larkinella sp. VNQ87 TaxID=3400921 RepID=UPI003BFC046D
MKTIASLSLLLGALTTTCAQDFRTLPPVEQPGVEETAYFGDQHPGFSSRIVPDSVAVRLVVSFLNDLMEGRFEAARDRIASDFQAFGPGLHDFLVLDELFTQWECNGRLFTSQELSIEDRQVVTVATGERHGQWVFLKAVWSARDKRSQGKAVRIPFFELAQVCDGRIQRTYISYGNDQLFYDFGFSLYSSGFALTQKR